MASFTGMCAVAAALLVAACAHERPQPREEPVIAWFDKWADTAWVPMKGGTNARNFNHWHVARGITLGADSATIELAPGVYRVTGMSITTFGYGEGTVTPYESPGYAFLMQVPQDSDESGSMQDPIYSEPSLVDGVVTVTTPTKYILGHQNGDSIPGIFLESGHKLDPRGGHLFARLIVQRLD